MFTVLSLCIGMQKYYFKLATMTQTEGCEHYVFSVERFTHLLLMVLALWWLSGDQMTSP